MSDEDSSDAYEIFLDVEIYNVQQKQAMVEIVSIIEQLKTKYEDPLVDGLVNNLQEIESIRFRREKLLNGYISDTLGGEDSVKEMKSEAASFVKDSLPNGNEDEASSDGSQLPREQLFQESNQKKRSSDISLEGETEHQRKRVRTATLDGDEVERHDQEMEYDEEQRRRQRDKEELEQQEMAAKKQQRLADQREHDPIEREKEARVQEREAEEQRRLQREKEELEQQEMAKVKVALRIQCLYRGLAARAKANELRLAAAKAEGAVTIQCLFRISTARAKAKTLRVAAAKTKVAINMQLLFRIASGRCARRATVKRVADIQRAWRGFMGRKEAMRLMEVKIRNIIEGLPDELAQHHVVVVSLKLLKALMDKLQEALNPQSPNLLGIPMITHRLIVIIQTLAHYKKMLKGHVSQREAKSMDTFINIKC